MDSEKFKRLDNLFILVVIAFLFLYAVVGAVRGDIYLPTRHGDFLHLQGFQAWLMSGAIVVVSLELFMRVRGPLFLSSTVETVVHVSLLVLFSLLFYVALWGTGCGGNCGS